jgi:hypothetical protein
MAIDLTGIRRVVISDLARPAYERLARDRQAEIRRRARAIVEGRELPEQDFGGGIVRFLLRNDTQVYIRLYPKFCRSPGGAIEAGSYAPPGLRVRCGFGFPGLTPWARLLRPSGANGTTEATRARLLFQIKSIELTQNEIIVRHVV